MLKEIKYLIYIFLIKNFNIFNNKNNKNMSFNLLYDKEELEAIAKKEDSNNKMEEYFNTQRSTYKDELLPLLEISKLQYNAENAAKIVEIQASTIVYRQRITDEIAFYLQRLSREKVKSKRAIQEKMVWYAAGKSPFNFTGKISNTQMSSIIDGHTAESIRATEIIESHIDFLRGVAKNLSDMGYQVKNTIELYNLLSRN